MRPRRKIGLLFSSELYFEGACACEGRGVVIILKTNSTMKSKCYHFK